MTRPLLPALAFLSALCLASCAGTSAGRACTQNSECDTGQTCDTSLPSGFCAKPCTASGSTSECPGNTICTPFVTALRCAPICQTQSECRTGYQCNGLTGGSTKSCQASL